MTRKPTLFPRKKRTAGRRAILGGFFFFVVSSVQAFPPSPYYSLYGIVRDQVGQTVTAEGAEIILLRGTEELARTPIISGVRLEQNYELRVRLDQNRSGTMPYSEKALATNSAFSLAVKINGATFYPISMSAPLTAGRGGERVQLDLNLGEDSDGDGLPDVWKQWQLYQAGYFPDENGNWPLHLITRDGDFDGDGVSNWVEFIAGTFAGDPTERFALEIKERTETHTRFEFFAVTGKTYAIEATTDMQTWDRVPFSVGQFPAIGAPSWLAQDVAIVSAFTAVPVDGKQFYRLTVR